MLSSFALSPHTGGQVVPGRMGSIGGELLSRFTLILDYKSEQVFLKKNQFYHRNFNQNKSGLNVVAGGEELKTFSVLHVMEGSPAAEAGILPGDIIVAINGKGSAQLRLEDIQETFHARSTQMVEIVVLRNKQYWSFTILLKNLI